MREKKTHTKNPTTPHVLLFQIEPTLLASLDEVSQEHYIWGGAKGAKKA